MARAFLALATVTLAIFSLMNAKPQKDVRDQLLAGTWELTRAEIADANGAISVDPNYGPRAKGLLIVDGDGRYSLQIFRPDRPKFASEDKARGTPEEYRAALLGLSTHTGRIIVDEANQKLLFRIDDAAFPNWEHTEQIRAYTLSGDELSYRIPPRPGGVSAISVWHRASR